MEGSRILTSRSVPRALRANPKLFHLSNGPNGHTLYAALVDVGLLTDSIIESLGVVVGDRFHFNLEAMSIPVIREGLISRHMDVGKGSFRRISAFPNKEGKM